MTSTVKLKLPDAVGVPDSGQLVAVAVPKAKPAGRAPEVIVQLYGPVPPTYEMLALYAVLITAAGNVVVVMVSLAATVSVKG